MRCVDKIKRKLKYNVNIVGQAKIKSNTNLI